MTDNWNDTDRLLTRRDTLSAGSAAVATLTGLAGCTSSDPESTVEETPTEEQTTQPPTTEENTSTSEPEEKSFDEIYDQQVEEDMEVLMERSQQIDDPDQPMLSRQQVNQIDDTDYEHMGHLLEEASMTMSKNYAISNDSQEHARMMRRMVHEDLDISKGQVRIFGRDTAGGGTYSAIFRKNDDGNWIKDLAVPGDWEEAYLRKDEGPIDETHESERGLWSIWDRSDPTTVSATDFITLRNSYEDVDRDDVDEGVYEDAKRHVDRGNDHVVVGEPYEEATVDYTAPAAERVANMMSWLENDTFNEEMAMVEQATEAYHNSEEPYLLMEIVDGEVTAAPTTEHQGPGTLYEIFDE